MSNRVMWSMSAGSVGLTLTYRDSAAPAQGLVGELAEEAPVAGPAERLADRLGERADLGDVVDRPRAAG